MFSVGKFIIIKKFHKTLECNLALLRYELCTLNHEEHACHNSDHKADYAENYTASADAYAGKLAALDAEYAAARETANFDTVLFGDRFPFVYLMDDYGLNYYAAFSGCSAESEASFETIVFLAGKVDELGLPTVLTIEGDNHRIAETIVGNTQAKDAKVLTMDSLQATTGEDVKNGTTYLGVMEANLNVLKQALSK